MPCGCRICFNCANERIRTDTDGKVVLNNFEKSKLYNNYLGYLNIKPSICACGLPFDVDTAIKITIRNVDDHTRQAHVRITNYVEKYCFSCRKNMSKAAGDNPMKINNPHNVIRIPIIQENDPTTANVPHLLCKDCIFPVRADINQKVKTGRLEPNCKTIPINCAVCIKTHQVETKILKPLLKTEDGGCCSIL
jgi:hypothetical protein